MERQLFKKSGVCLKGFRCPDRHTGNKIPSMTTFCNIMMGNLFGVREEVERLNKKVDDIQEDEKKIYEELHCNRDDLSLDLDQKFDRVRTDMTILKGSFPSH